MNKINIYLFKLTYKYILINFFVISIFILFINFIELSRILSEDRKNFFNFIYFSFLKFPTILNEILPFVTIISISFLIRNLINNNEFISLRNLGYSIVDIFIPIAISVFFVGIIFILIVNPISVFLETVYDKEINSNEESLYSIKVSNNEMWIKNETHKQSTNFINIKNIDLQDLVAKKIKILIISDEVNKFLQAESGIFIGNNFNLTNVKHYNFKNNVFEHLDKYELKINFNKQNLVNSIAKYKLIPFYNYIDHTNTLGKFNLYSPEIGLFYLSEALKPIFIVVLSFVILSFSGKFKRNENFFKVLFVSILIGFLIFLFKEIITKLTISFSINFVISYLIILVIPLLIGLYQVNKIEND